MNIFILKAYGYQKINSRYNNCNIIVRKGKFFLRGDEDTKMMNMATEYIFHSMFSQLHDQQVNLQICDNQY
jgi:hypothetical protein